MRPKKLQFDGKKLVNNIKFILPIKLNFANVTFLINSNFKFFN